MSVKLISATKEDMKTIWKMQVEAFTSLLEKYHDYDMSPATESFERIMQKFEQPWTTYFFIESDGEKVGAIRIIDKNDGSRKKISPIWIMPAFRNKGYAQQAIKEAEKLYGSDHWCLDTILQEKGNLHLYEKLGYHQTGKTEHINDRMDIVFYEKDSISYRTMSIDDYDKVYALWMSCKNMGFNNLDDSREGIERFLKRNPNTSFVAEDKEKITGIVLAGHDGRRGYIYHMSVSEDCRRQGIAGSLLEHSLDALKNEGINKVALLVFNRNEVGNAFWEKQGFTIREDVAYRNKALTEIIRIDT